MSVADVIPGGFGGLFGDGNNSVTACGESADICEAVRSCGSNNPCEAAWQATYAYQADQQFQMAKWQAVLGLAYGYLQYRSADRTADRQYDIANRQMAIAEEEYARYKCVYVECEDAWQAEVCAEELPEAEYDVHADRAQRDVRRLFSISRKKLERTRSRYCTSDMMRKLCEMEKAETLTMISARDTAYRYAESRQDFYSARRETRKLNMVSQGRDIMSGQSTTFQNAIAPASAALTARNKASSDLATNVFGVGNSFLNSYYTQLNPFPYGSGYTGTGATTSGAGTTNVSGFPSAGGAAFAG